MKIDAADLTLVEVNLGKETGLEKHNTLEVYRPGPQPEYIGTLHYGVYDRPCAFLPFENCTQSPQKTNPQGR